MESRGRKRYTSWPTEIILLFCETGKVPWLCQEMSIRTTVCHLIYNEMTNNSNSVVFLSFFLVSRNLSLCVITKESLCSWWFLNRRTKLKYSEMKSWDDFYEKTNQEVKGTFISPWLSALQIFKSVNLKTQTEKEK